MLFWFSCDAGKKKEPKFGALAWGTGDGLAWARAQGDARGKAPHSSTVAVLIRATRPTNGSRFLVCSATQAIARWDPRLGSNNGSCCKGLKSKPLTRAVKRRPR